MAGIGSQLDGNRIYAHLTILMIGGKVNNLDKLKKMRWQAIQSFKARISPAKPVYVFHHIPKCGGTSMEKVLARWFVFVPDYRTGWSSDIPGKKDLRKLRSGHCLVGLYDSEGYYLHQRYPEMLTSDRFRLITLVRDPLQVRLSLYHYEKKLKVGLYNQMNKLEDHVFSGGNYLADRFPATLENYKEVIDRYFFVGILEQPQASLDVLAYMIGKPPQEFPWENATRSHGGSASDGLSEEQVARFHEKNSLDYLVYDYCVQKFREKLAMLDAVKKSESVSEVVAP
jgi:hypothetical protein